MTFPAHAALTAKELIDRYHKGDRNFEQTHLHDSHLQGACLHGIDLSESILDHVDFKGADLRGADLAWSDLSYANLQGADLRGAILTRADLSYANLQGANLLKADLSLANLNHANLSGATMPDGTIAQHQEIMQEVTTIDDEAE
ncbi:MAG: pentapeptide repeat-containing protein [Pseudanabaenaceae cyanobacterium bins.39]|nr:pentapeptide repeat-containing protein [Pseudanabaenaceae cyanobacterium bins.39]